ncbi:hypothetical protein NHQ30_002933 [Ciborinia camelliae]|nr:hypothetical protein NHQ30_002933 [Ciborinia camelliae]
MGAESTSAFTRQPLKFLYGVFQIVTLPIRLTWILLYYIPKPLRQNPNWSYHSAVGLEIFLVWWHYTAKVHYRTPKSLSPGMLKDRFVVIEPSVTSPSIYRGVANHSIVRPITIGAAWYPTRYTPSLEDGVPQRVAIHFHGGGYVLGGCRPTESPWGPQVLAKHLKGPVLQIQYRLAAEEAAYFPAALQDGLTAYSYVLNELNVRPQDIILSGESAGAHIVIAMIRYLSSGEGKGTLPLPRAGLLWSPWVNLVPNQLTLDDHPNAKTDYMLGSILEWGASSFTPPGWDRGHPYISPAGNEFKSPVPLFIQTGTLEVLYEQHVKFAKAMKECGTKVEFLEIQNAPHDTFGAGLILGFVKEAEAAAEKAVKFVEDVKYDDGA